MTFFEFLVSRSKFGTVVAAACLVVAGGCGAGYSGPTGTVRGTVTINGEPVPAGTGVAFISDDGFTASGQVDAGGSYELSSLTGKQIPAVTYKVMISGAAPGVTTDDADYDAMMEASAAGTLPAAPVAESVIPSKYGSTGTSGLSYTVNTGENTISIELQ
jgi:hypothetical protein